MALTYEDDDPLTRALAPPPDETAEEKEERLKAEGEARRVSQEIDEQLKADRAALKKKRPVKVLLLGQSESGKSTTLKNFQITYSPKAWSEERNAWRTVIQFNLVRNVNTILDLLSEELVPPNAGPDALLPDTDVSDDDDDVPTPPRSGQAPRFTERHSLLKLRLAPLRELQSDLEAMLGASSGEEVPHARSPTSRREAFIRSHVSWKSHAHDREHGLSQKLREAKAHEISEVIAVSADDMAALWADPAVQQMLWRRRMRTEAMSGFFLPDAHRIAAKDYTPSNDDIVRARLRTLGVQEYRIKFETGPATGSEWCLYDVGGSRTQRAAWFPYFDDCDAIIFLAPVNCFDERLVEDRRVNRLEDSYMLWKLVCSSKLLAKTHLILFLNKCDLLDLKLRGGVRLKDYVKSFGDRSNDMQTASKYFSQHFKEILRRNSPEPRDFKVHTTSVIDTQATAATLSHVEEGILKAHLRSIDLI